MSSHYEPISTDSDNENDYVAETAPMIEDDARTERTRSTDRSYYFQQGDRPHFFQGGTTDSDEDPEEESPPSTDHRAPLPTANSEARPAGRQTARIRVTMPKPQQWTRSRSPTPSTDPYARRPPGFHIWERTLRTLERWRDSRQYTPVPQEGESSSVRQEFLLDTTPIIVDKIARHEEKLDMIEDVVMDMPGNEALGELQYQVDNADDNISHVNDEVQNLKTRVEAMARQFKNMDCSINRMERQMGDCHTMTAMAQGITQDRLWEFFKKEGK